MIHKILSLVQMHTDLDFSSNRLSMIERRIKNRCILNNCNSFEEYHELLVNESSEIINLSNSLTINVSQFFRDPLTFEILNTKILPELFNRQKKNLRIWSAGCAKGEEPYSISIIINDILKKNKIDKKVIIFATDIDKSAISIAKEGNYSRKSLGNMKLSHYDNYFTFDGEKYSITSEIKKIVKFYEHDLLNPKQLAPIESIYGNFDLILCRNLLIYFTPEYQNIIIKLLYKSLAISGFLVLGEAESLSENYKYQFSQITDQCKIFKKPGIENKLFKL